MNGGRAPHVLRDVLLALLLTLAAAPARLLTTT